MKTLLSSTLAVLCLLPATTNASGADRLYELCLTEQFVEAVTSGKEDIHTATGFISIALIEAALWRATPECLKEKNEAVEELLLIMKDSDAMTPVEAEKEIIKGTIIDLTAELHIAATSG